MPISSHQQTHSHAQFAFSYPPANSSLVFSSHPSTSGTSSSHSQAKFSAERDEGYSDEMEELEDGDVKPTIAGYGGSGASPKKKLRVTLPRGRACVACRNRKLKCTGEKPCATCIKAEIECRYEEVQRRKPRHVLLEERVVELESLLISRGEQPPPSQLTNATPVLTHVVPEASPTREEPADITIPRRAPSRPKISRKVSANSASPFRGTPIPGSAAPQPPSLSEGQEALAQPTEAGNQLALSLHSHRDASLVGLPTPSFRPAGEIQAQSLLELQLITFVLPYTPFLATPLHPQRFLTLLTLEPSHPSRPHPALLCILFAEAIRILENGTPAPKRQSVAGVSDWSASMPPPTSDLDKAWLLSQVRGNSLLYLERARTELDNGIRSVDRPFDLVRAGISIARYLYSLGRFIEGWNVPIARLAVSCGLHRLTGNVTRPLPFSPTGEYPPTERLPLPYGSTEFYLHHHAITTPPQPLPALRMRPLIIPPPRDEIELAERVMTFWAAKSQDWAAGVGWGWSIAFDDDDCTSEWPWGSGGPEAKPLAQTSQRFGIRDLFDVNSPLHMSPYPESTYVLSMKSMCLLSRASHLNDLPESSIPYLHMDGRIVPDHIPPLHKIQAVETALSIFRQRLPAEYTYPPPQAAMRQESTETMADAKYHAMSDPWYILLHVNLYTAEMFTSREMANYDTSAYHRAIGCARGVVGLVANLKAEDWVHLDVVVPVNLSIVARLLVKEAGRLQAMGQIPAAKMALDEAEVLHRALSGDCARWMPMAGLHALIVGRVREGLAEKEGEYERV